jgi:hypothetical protein
MGEGAQTAGKAPGSGLISPRRAGSLRAQERPAALAAGAPLTLFLPERLAS